MYRYKRLPYGAAPVEICFKEKYTKYLKIYQMWFALQMTFWLWVMIVMARTMMTHYEKYYKYADG